MSVARLLHMLSLLALCQPLYALKANFQREPAPVAGPTGLLRNGTRPVTKLMLNRDHQDSMRRHMSHEEKNFLLGILKAESNSSAGQPVQLLESTHAAHLRDHTHSAQLRRSNSSYRQLDTSEIISKVSKSLPVWEGEGGGKTLADLWAHFQGRLTSAVERFHPKRHDRNFRTLIVAPVSGDLETVFTFEHNFRKLKKNKAGDTFSFALFHYDGNTELWEPNHWYWDEKTSIVLRDTKQRCKAEVWAAIPVSLASQYDYIWLMDGDLDLGYFSWDLYRGVLAGLDPLVSQPSVLGKYPGRRATDINFLKMMGITDDGNFPVAQEVNRTECMAAVLSTRVWPALHARLQKNDLSSAWYISDFWDAVSFAAARSCGTAGDIFVNAAPVRHLDHRDLLRHDSIGSTHGCKRGCGLNNVNCEPMRALEKDAVEKGLEGYCAVDRENFLDCADDMRTCQTMLAHSTRKRIWSINLEPMED